jgi:hypothetical protein
MHSVSDMQLVGQVGLDPSHAYGLHAGIPALPAGAATQLPVAHVPHAPHAELQQTPETQLVVVHWSAAVHAAPAACLGAHVLAEVQKALAMHWVSLVQLVGHEPLAQRYGSQETPVLVMVHAPAPLQTAPSTALPLVEQVVEPQDVP